MLVYWLLAEWEGKRMMRELRRGIESGQRFPYEARYVRADDV